MTCIARANCSTVAHPPAIEPPSSCGCDIEGQIGHLNEEDVRPAVEELDLTRVGKLLQREEPSLTNEDVSRLVTGYREFLIRVATCGLTTEIKPSPEEDKVWHAHIMFTHQYAEDCEACFGGMIHHEPFVD